MRVVASSVSVYQAMCRAVAAAPRAHKRPPQQAYSRYYRKSCPWLPAYQTQGGGDVQAVGASGWWGRNVNWERRCGRVMGPVLSGTGGTRRLRTVPQITPSSRLAMMPPPASQASLDPRPIPAHVAGKTVRRCPLARLPPPLTSNPTEHYALHLMSISSKVRKNSVVIPVQVALTPHRRIPGHSAGS